MAGTNRTEQESSAERVSERKPAAMARERPAARQLGALPAAMVAPGLSVLNR